MGTARSRRTVVRPESNDWARLLHGLDQGIGPHNADDAGVLSAFPP
jgi:hypothetical protein